MHKMPKERIKFVDSDELSEYLEDINKLDHRRYVRDDIDDYMKVRIYHFIVGSKYYKSSSPSLETRNHEFPEIVRSLLTKPERQYSNILLNDTDLSIRIKQYVILIDPIYSREPNLDGIPKDLDSMITDEPVNDIEYFVISENITEKKLKDIVNIIQLPECLTDNKMNIHKLVNIMDCTSNLLRSWYIENSNPYIYISPPNCLALDSDSVYKPLITLHQKARDDFQPKRGRASSFQLSQPYYVNIRWLNINYDMDRIYSFDENCYSLLIRLKLNNLLECFIYPLSRLWSISTYTTSNINSIGLKLILDFLQEYKSNESFSDKIDSNIDVYYLSNFKMYMDGLLNMSDEKRYYLQKNDITLEEFIKKSLYSYLEEINIMIECMKVKSLDIILFDLPDSYANLDRKKIYDYLEANHFS